MSITIGELGRRPRTAIVALGLLSAFGPISLDVYLPALPHIGRDLHATVASTQLTLSGSLAGLALGQLLVGPLSDRIGRRRPLLLGLLGFVLLSLVCAFAPTIEVLIVARIVQGLCGAAGLVLARAVVRDAFPDARIADVFSLLMLVNGLAPVLAPLLGGALLHVMPWRGLFGALAVIGTAIAAVTIASLPETLPPERRHAGGIAAIKDAAREVSSDRLFRGATAVLALASATLFTYISLSSFVLQTAFRLSASAFSGVFAMNSVAIILGGRLSQLLLRRIGTHGVLGLGLVTMSVGSVIALLSAVLDLGLGGLLPGLALAIGSVGLVMPNATALALLRHGRSAGTASALLGALQYLTGALAGPLVSLGGASATAMTLGMTVAATLGVGVWAYVVRPAARPATGSATVPAASFPAPDEVPITG